jgi:hypothetical protein
MYLFCLVGLADPTVRLAGIERGIGLGLKQSIPSLIRYGKGPVLQTITFINVLKAKVDFSKYLCQYGKTRNMI